MKVVLLTIVFLMLLVPSTGFVFAQDSSLSENAEERLRQIEDKRSTSSSESTASADKKPGMFSFYEGTIVSIGNSTILLKNETSDKLIYTVDTTKYINIDSTGKKLIGFGDLKINESIFVLGVPSENFNGTAKFIVRDQQKQIKTFSLIGKVSEIKENSLVLQDFKRTDLPKITLSLRAGLSIVSPNKKQLNLSDITLNIDVIVASGTIDDKGSLNAEEIFINKTTFKTLATPSAQ